MAKSGKTVSTLAGLVDGAFESDEDPQVTDVTHDSREVGPGSMYVAVRGGNVDGHSFVPAAVASGAVAVCVDHAMGSGVAELIVDDTRQVMGALAAAVHDHPSLSLAVVGVTGTNGKTTVTHYVESIATDAGLTTGLVGTIHTRAAGAAVPATLTTPEAPQFQRLLAEMRDQGVALVAAEVSSHALEYGRVRGTRFAVAAFTNLSQDHLDFHGDMAAYRAAKKRLFTDYEVGTAVINIDDPAGSEIASSYRGRMLSVGEGGDFAIREIEPARGRTSFTVESTHGTRRLSAPVIGDFNVSNLVMAGACCIAAGIPVEEVFEAMTRVRGVPGRFEVVSGEDPIIVIVDYAHTPEGVAAAVRTGRRLGEGRVIALLGAGGDRDRRKRPAMGAALSQADLAVVTSDNPRSEDPAEIAAAVLSGVDPSTEHMVEIDRRRAIDIAIDRAEDGDIVLVLGRGHEFVQDLGTEEVEFDDRVVAAETLQQRRSAESRGRSGSMST